MSKIEILNEDLSNKIAAGEVVEKTMNVVKELVENAIDAESNNIKIELIDSGIKEIKITDNGIGMETDDAVLAFSRHATSKLKKLEDLFYIDTLGFRGEALPSIASISNIILKTSTGESGTEVIINGGKIDSVNDAELLKGTRITVRNLFYNTPVRLKYLKSPNTELANIVDYINKMALSFPNIKFTLINNEKVLLNTDGSENLLKVIYNIYGAEITKKLIELDCSNADYKVKGYISYPEQTKSNRNAITILVNNRVIRNNEVIKAIIDSYHTYIPVDRYPIIVLNIEVDPILIDVNIHPTKMDIKFSKMESLKELLAKSITEKLEIINLIPEIKEKLEDNKIENKIREILSNNKQEETSEKPVYEETILDFEINEANVGHNSNGEAASYEQNRIKKMYPIGLVHATYVIAENEDGMYIIDQHAAAERINYEKYLESLSKHDNSTIEMLIPIKIEFPSNEYILLKEKLNILENMGILIEEFGINTILIRSHPWWLSKLATEEAIKKIIDIIIVEEEFDSKKFCEKVAITLACKLSIKANDHITMTDMEDLLERLRNAKNPFTCPHGRPTIISYSKYELEKLFKRVA